jgi:hypothetical protein
MGGKCVREGKGRGNQPWGKCVGEGARPSRQLGLHRTAGCRMELQGCMGCPWVGCGGAGVVVCRWGIDLGQQMGACRTAGHWVVGSGVCVDTGVVTRGCTGIRDKQG